MDSHFQLIALSQMNRMNADGRRKRGIMVEFLSDKFGISP